MPKKVVFLVLGAIGALMLIGMCAGALSAAVGKKPNPAPTETVTVTPTVTKTASKPPVQTKAADPTKTPKPVTTIRGDDLLQIGDDVPAGTYRAVEPIEPGQMCYWKKSSDAEGSDIIDNNLPTGGRPQVTLKKGQWFTSQGCPDWAKK